MFCPSAENFVRRIIEIIIVVSLFISVRLRSGLTMAYNLFIPETNLRLSLQIGIDTRRFVSGIFVKYTTFTNHQMGFLHFEYFWYLHVCIPRLFCCCYVLIFPEYNANRCRLLINGWHSYGGGYVFLLFLKVLLCFLHR